MNRFTLLTTIALAGLAAGCTSSTAQKKETGDAASPTPSAVRTNGNVVMANTPKVPGGPPAIDAANSSRTSRRGRRERVDMDPSATPLPLKFEKAPEDSEFALSMDQKGTVVETRIFRKHAQIQKAELLWVDAKTKVLRLLLRNGKTAEARTDKLESIRSISADTLLAAVGIKGGKNTADRPGPTPRR